MNPISSAVFCEKQEFREVGHKPGDTPTIALIIVFDCLRIILNLVYQSEKARLNFNHSMKGSLVSGTIYAQKADQKGSLPQKDPLFSSNSLFLYKLILYTVNFLIQFTAVVLVGIS